MELDRPRLSANARVGASADLDTGARQDGMAALIATAGLVTKAGSPAEPGRIARSRLVSGGGPVAGGGLIAIALAAALLLWPAVWNGYPIVFADTGTYLSQAIHRYAGWDRPVFYSLFMLPLHATTTVWPVVVTQALIAAYVLHLVCRVLVPALPAGIFVAGIAVLSLATWLPWLVSELTPDLFTPLLVLLLAILAWTPDRVSRAEQVCLVALAACMIASQLSSLPLACVLLAGLVLLSVWRGAARRPVGLGRAPSLPRRMLLIVLPPALAITGLCTVNLGAHGRFAISPFGNVFLLARVIYDGPGMATLRRDCPSRGWRLCPFLDRFPTDSDGFLWNRNSPLTLAGGAKAVSQDAGAIIVAALRSDPAGAARAAIGNTLEQLRRFVSGDGLEPWPEQVTPWIERDFPSAERAAYAAARQQRGLLSVPAALAAIHQVVSLLGVAACFALLPAVARRRPQCLGFLAVVLLALPFGAAITGGLSTPHDRYQSRIMWLPPLVAILSFASLRCSFASSRAAEPLPCQSVGQSDIFAGPSPEPSGGAPSLAGPP